MSTAHESHIFLLYAHHFLLICNVAIKNGINTMTNRLFYWNVLMAQDSLAFDTEKIVHVVLSQVTNGHCLYLRWTDVSKLSLHNYGRLYSPDGQTLHAWGHVICLVNIPHLEESSCGQSIYSVESMVLHHHPQNLESIWVFVEIRLVN